VAGGGKLWLRCALLYTVGGCVSSTTVGLALGAIGESFVEKVSDGPRLYLIGILSLILALREWKLLQFSIPEFKRQTEKTWAHEFGPEVASAMWGIHIGLGFGTRINHGGFWVLVAIALGFGSPKYGAILMLTYWLARTLPVWVAPTLLDSTSEAMELPGAALLQGRLFERMVGIGLLSTAVIAFVGAARVASLV